MSAPRITTIRFTGKLYGSPDEGGPFGQITRFRPGYTSYLTPVEAAPFYESLTIRYRRIDSSGFMPDIDETATYTREPIRPSTNVRLEATGLEGVSTLKPSSGCFVAVLDHDMEALLNTKSIAIRDPKKQHPILYASGGYFDNWSFIWQAVGASTRKPLTLWGPYSGVDASGWSPSKWRDLRGSYTVSLPPGVITNTIDWTLA